MRIEFTFKMFLILNAVILLINYDFIRLVKK